ncbi:LytTR family DNA-binding domain-containing protein [soil metagenome]
MKAIIIDDEYSSSESLHLLLKNYCPQVEVTAICNDARESISIIHTHRPDVIFLDVEMPHLDGFAVLKAAHSFIRQVIFTTAHGKYAIRALREQAHDYLVKPFDVEELLAAIERLAVHSFPDPQSTRIEKLEMQLRKNSATHLALQTSEGFSMVKHEEIIRLEAESNYTYVYTSLKKYLITRQLGYYEEQLSEAGFIRVHSSHLVNITHIKNYRRGDGGYVVMSDGTNVEVSRSRKKDLLRVLLGEES